MQRLLESGGTEKCEEAVVKGLDWLQETQNADGSWGNSNKAAMTGFAILAYLGHCETPLSEKYGDTVLRGMTWLVDLGMKQNGRLTSGAEPNPQPYEHGIATYALGESTTFCKQLSINVPNLPEVTQKAGQYIIDNQHKSGGWDYGYKEDSGRGGDLSVSAWQIQALKACKHTGMDFRNMSSCIRKALDYVEQCQKADGGFGYTPNGGAHSANGYATLTGAGEGVALADSKITVSIAFGGSAKFRELTLVRVPKDSQGREWMLDPAQVDDRFASRLISRRDAARLRRPGKEKP